MATTTNEPIKCPHCEATFKKATGLGSHMLKAHGIPGSSKTVLAIRAAKKHPEKTNATWAFRQKDGRYKCPECGALVVSAAALGSHRRLKHNIGGSGREAVANMRLGRTSAVKTKYECPECGEMLPSPLKLGNHRWMKHKIRGESYDAERKRSGASKLGNLERTSDGRIKCPLCEFTTSGFAGMGMHLKAHRTQGHDLPALPEPTPTPTRERTALVKANQNAHPTSTHNGHHPQTADDGNHRLEAAATLAAGRVQELCSRLAFEHDLPARTLTALVLRTVATASALR